MKHDTTDNRPLNDPTLTHPWKVGPVEAVTFLNAVVVDAASASLLGDGRPQLVVVEHGIISYVGEDTTRAKGLVVDIKHQYLCPGLIDTHVHIAAVPGGVGHKEMMAIPPEVVSLRSTYVLKKMLERGFTTVRDVAGASKNMAIALAEGLVEGPRLFQGGLALSQTCGHGDFGPPAQSCCGGHSNIVAHVCDGVPAVLKATREQIRAGADHIKIMCGGGVASVADGLDTVQFTPEELRAITQTCDFMGGIHTTAHAYTSRAVRHAIDNGVKGIEHGNLIDQATAVYMAEKGIFYTPTLAVSRSTNRPPFNKTISADQLAKNQRVMEGGARALKYAYDAGVTMCYGSDMLASKHPLQSEEFSVLAEYLPSPVVLQMATINPAKLLRQEGKLGVIAPGAVGDMIVLKSNPLDDITILDGGDEILGVIQGGRQMHWRL